MCILFVIGEHSGSTLHRTARKVGPGIVIPTNARHYNWLRLWQVIEHLLREVERLLDDLLRCEGQPLIHANIGESWRQQHLKVHECLVARIFNVVRFRHGNVTNVASLEVEGPR